MPERASLNQVSQLGVEATAGTAVAATRRLQSIDITPSVGIDIDQFRPSGFKYRTVTSTLREWSEAGVSGRGTYNELVYVLSGVVNTGVVTTPDAVNAASARKWTFTSSTTADDNPKTYTVEHGAAGAASNNGRFSYGLFTEFSMSWSRTGAVEIGGSMLGRRYDPNFGTMAAATSIDPVVINPTEITVYMDASRTNAQSNATAYKLDRVVSGEFSIGGRYGPVFVVDQANPGHVAHVETEPDVTLTLTLQADAEALAIVTGMMRSGATQFVRVRAVGANLGGAVTNEALIDVAVKVADVGDFSDADGVYAIEITFVAVHDSAWTKAYEIALVNTLAAL